MTDQSVKKVEADHSPQGEMGQTYLASGKKLAMRRWNEESGKEKQEHECPYETVGYVLEGKAELHLGDQKIVLQPGDSWVVPESAPHTYKILESFQAIEATAPPARAHARDE